MGTIHGGVWGVSLLLDREAGVIIVCLVPGVRTVMKGPGRIIPPEWVIRGRKCVEVVGGCRLLKVLLVRVCGGRQRGRGLEEVVRLMRGHGEGWGCRNRGRRRKVRRLELCHDEMVRWEEVVWQVWTLDCHYSHWSIHRPLSLSGLAAPLPALADTDHHTVASPAANQRQENCADGGLTNHSWPPAPLAARAPHSPGRAGPGCAQPRGRA